MSPHPARVPSVGVENGLETASVVNCDGVATVPGDRLGPQIGTLLEEQEAALAAALVAAFDLWL